MADFVAPSSSTLKGTLSISISGTMPGTTGTFTNAQLVAALGSDQTGSLGKFLARTDLANAAAAETAFRNLCGEITIRQTGGTAAPVLPKMSWAAGIGTKPSLDVTIAGGASDEVVEVCVRTAHSIIQ